METPSKGEKNKVNKIFQTMKHNSSKSNKSYFGFLQARDTPQAYSNYCIYNLYLFTHTNFTYLLELLY